VTTEFIGARFFDGRNRDRGWASSVVRRERAPGRLVVLDVTTTDQSLIAFLSSLDKSPMHIQETGTESTSYRFVWASGYANGATLRVQGVLEDVWPGRSDETATS